MIENINGAGAGARSKGSSEKVLEYVEYSSEKMLPTEQYVLQQLISDTSYRPYYFTESKSGGEIDFIIQKGVDIIPIEVKAEENLRAKSLKVYCEKYAPRVAIRTSMSNYREQDWMVNMPLWAVSQF